MANWLINFEIMLIEKYISKNHKIQGYSNLAPVMLTQLSRWLYYLYSFDFACAITAEECASSIVVFSPAIWAPACWQWHQSCVWPNSSVVKCIMEKFCEVHDSLIFCVYIPPGPSTPGYISQQGSPVCFTVNTGGFQLYRMNWSYNGAYIIC